MYPCAILFHLPGATLCNQKWTCGTAETGEVRSSLTMARRNLGTEFGQGLLMRWENSTNP